MNTKQQIIAALHAWIKQRPGLEFGNYGNVSAYRSEMRSITRDRHDAEQLLMRVSNSSITGEQLMAAFPRAYSGRLTCTKRDDGAIVIDYCTGQYFPTEYRKAVCAVLAGALWDYYREDFAKTPAGKIGIDRPGDLIRARFRREYGARIQGRWFN